MIDDREDMYEIEDHNSHDDLDTKVERIDANFDTTDENNFDIIDMNNNLSQPEKKKESSETKLRKKNPIYNSNNKVKLINSKKGDINVIKKASISKKNLKLNQLDLLKQDNNEIDEDNKLSSIEIKNISFKEHYSGELPNNNSNFGSKFSPSKNSALRKELEVELGNNNNNRKQNTIEQANLNNMNNNYSLSHFESFKKGGFPSGTLKNTPSLNKYKNTKNTKSTFRSNKALEQMRNLEKKEVDKNTNSNNNVNNNKTTINTNKSKKAKNKSNSNLTLTNNIASSNNDTTNKKTKNKDLGKISNLSSENQVNADQKKKINKPMTPYCEVLKKNTESVNPNIASMAKSKINWGKQVHDAVSAEKNLNKPEQEAFCVHEKSICQNSEIYEDKNSIITKGERIYMKNMAEKTLKYILEEKERKQKLSENTETTFKPSLHLTAYYKPNEYNNSHHLLETTCYKNKTVYTKPDSFYEDDIKIEDEIELMKQERKVASWDQIDKHTERLYKDHEARLVNRSVLTDSYYNEICQPTPSINDKSKPDPSNFYSRLQNWIARQKEKEEERKGIAKMNQTNNKPFFKPLVNDSPRKLKLSGRPSAGDELLLKLHNDYKEKIEKRENLHKSNLEKVKQDSERPLVSPKSKNLNEKNKKELFSKIFEMLDYNQDNKISYDEDFEEAMKNVPKHIVKILEPLFEEFKENKEVLTIKDFILSCGRLYDILDYWEKSELFNYIFKIKKNTSNREKRIITSIEKDKADFTHQPTITDKSKTIFDSSEKYSGLDFLKRNSTYLETRKRVMTDGIEKRDAEEKKSKIIIIININIIILECTFKPYVDYSKFLHLWKKPIQEVIEPEPVQEEPPEEDPPIEEETPVEDDEKKKKKKKLKVYKVS